MDGWKEANWGSSAHYNRSASTHWHPNPPHSHYCPYNYSLSNVSSIAQHSFVGRLHYKLQECNVSTRQVLPVLNTYLFEEYKWSLKTVNTATGTLLYESKTICLNQFHSKFVALQSFHSEDTLNLINDECCTMNAYRCIDLSVCHLNTYLNHGRWSIANIIYDHSYPIYHMITWAGWFE